MGVAIPTQMGTIGDMMTAVNSEDRLASALRDVLVFAQRDFPEWCSQDAADERMRVYANASAVLMDFDGDRPAAGQLAAEPALALVA